MKVDNEKAPIKVDNDSGGDDAAVVDTTIYDEPGGSDVAYLDANDAVTISDCNQGWCEITEPQEGYVWGEDVGR